MGSRAASRGRDATLCAGHRHGRGGGLCRRRRRFGAWRAAPLTPTSAPALVGRAKAKRAARRPQPARRTLQGDVRRARWRRLPPPPAWPKMADLLGQSAFRRPHRQFGAALGAGHPAAPTRRCLPPRRARSRPWTRVHQRAPKPPTGPADGQGTHVVLATVGRAWRILTTRVQRGERVGAVGSGAAHAATASLHLAKPHGHACSAPAQHPS